MKLKGMKNLGGRDKKLEVTNPEAEALL